MKKGEIYIVQFDPSVGREYRGYRPALVVQSVEIETSPVVTIVPLTSKVEKAYISDVLIPLSRRNGLAMNSVALVRFIMSYDRSRFMNPDFSKSTGSQPRCVGVAEVDLMEQVEASLRVHLGLNN
jgi:mRNA interferase MazF